MSALLAAIPYAALQIDRAVRTVLRGFGGAPLVAILLLAGAGIPLAVEGSRQQPIAETVDGMRDGVASLSSWVRMTGRIVTLTAPEAVAAGQHVQSLLIEPSGDAIVLSSDVPLDDRTEVTGRISNSAYADVVARSVGGPRFPDEDLDVIDRYVLTVDDPIVPPQERDWTLVWAMVVSSGVLVAGHAVGYPVVRMQRSGTRQGVRPLREEEVMRLRVVEPQDETGLRLRAPRAVLRRLTRRAEDDAYFALEIDGRPRPLHFRRHRWSTAAAGTLWTVLEQVPVVQVRDWGIEVILALDSQADRERALASFLVPNDAGPAGEIHAHAD